MLKKYINLPNLTLLTALCLSSVAAWFAIAGLVTIFPAKATAIMIMGGIIEVAKIVATVWLRKYWSVAPLTYKVFMVPMVVIAMVLTSMGTFGFLSGAHSEQGAVSGDVAAKVAIIDEKIKTQRDNADLARKALQQMDEQVNQRLSRSDNEQGAERAVQIRRQQAPERARLQKEITDAQAVIAKLNEERAPIASQLRKVEAEVGPIKYIAALVYGDNPDANTLEKAVRWVIIMLVLVFDPFAIALVLAGNASKTWPEPQTEEEVKVTEVIEPPKPPVEEKQEDIVQPIIQETTPWPEVVDPPQEEQPVKDDFDLSKYPYLNKGGFGFKESKPMVWRPEPPVPVESDPTVECTRCGTTLVDGWCPDKACGTVQLPEPPEPEPEVEVPVEVPPPSNVDTNQKLPFLKLRTDEEESSISTGFGTQFPTNPKRGDIFVRVDMLPNKVYKWDNARWIEINKSNTDAYMYNDSYIEYLIDKVDSGEYDVDLLTENEKDQIRTYLRNVNSNRNILGNA